MASDETMTLAKTSPGMLTFERRHWAIVIPPNKTASTTNGKPMANSPSSNPGAWLHTARHKDQAGQRNSEGGTNDSQN